MIDTPAFRADVCRVALTHSLGCACLICRAAEGDLEAFEALVAEAVAREHDPLPGSPDVTPHDLEAHAKKYGPEGVGDVARAAGLDVEVPQQATVPQRRRRR